MTLGSLDSSTLLGEDKKHCCEAQVSTSIPKGMSITSKPKDSIDGDAENEEISLATLLMGYHAYMQWVTKKAITTCM